VHQVRHALAGLLQRAQRRASKPTPVAASASRSVCIGSDWPVIPFTSQRTATACRRERGCGATRLAT
jgi:hypothetical protein